MLLPAGLMRIEEARSLVLAEALPLPVESRPLHESLGMVLAETLHAPHDLPPFDNSTMDGIAVRASDTLGAEAGHGVELSVVQTIAAGDLARVPLLSGEAAKIMTGAPLPEGADAVVRCESAREAGSRVVIFEAVRPGKSIRRAGEDIEAGTIALAAGDVLGPAEIGLMASLGIPVVPVHRRPRVAIVSTGSELTEADRPLRPGQIRASNGYSLRALCQELRIEPEVLGIAPDDRAATRSLLAKGLEYDVLLTTGGVSVGDFDLVKEVQQELGVQRRLVGVDMRPGKALVFGVRGRTLVFGLPGNPASAMVSFELFVRPALLRLMGRRRTTRPVYKAVAEESLPGSDEGVHVVRVRARWEEDGWRVSSTGDQGSGRLRSMIGANGLVFVPEGSNIQAGAQADLLLLGEDPGAE